MKRSSLWLAAALAALTGARGVAQAQTVASALSNFDSDVRNYNLVSLGNVSLNGVSDTQMGLAIKGNLSITSNSTGIADNGSTYGLTGDPTLYVAGSLTIGSGENATLGSGYAALPGTSSWTWNQTPETLTKSGEGSFGWTNANSTSTYDSSNPLSNPIPSNWNWNTITNNAKNDSSTLQNAASSTWTGTDTTTASTITGSVWIDGNTVHFGIKDANGNTIDVGSTPPEPAAGSTVIFNLDPNLVTSNATIQFDQSSTSVNYVVNVLNTTGSSLFDSSSVNMSGSASTIADELLWNVEGTGTVTLGNGNFYGSVLAPTATIASGNSTYITGQVLAGGFAETGGELHYDPFSALAIGGIVPEPATFAIFAIGLCGLAIMARRKLIG